MTPIELMLPPTILMAIVCGILSLTCVWEAYKARSMIMATVYSCVGLSIAGLGGVLLWI